ncbi:MAG: AMP-binding protein, partial [Rhodothermales bacterium]|nr:AMP-binding protein [Rhodothermales bacterium]
MGQSDLPSLIHAYFQFQADRVPDVIALRDGHKRVTYSDLDQESEKLAMALAARGVTTGSYIGVHMERSADYVACILGILKANAAVVPLPPSYPTERLRGILEFAELDLVIDSRASPIDQSAGVHTQCFEQLIAEDAPAISRVRGKPTQAAFVLCSSGSTGNPKMIVRSHGSFFHRLEWAWREHPFTEGDTGCQKAHMTTTHSLYELFEPLLSGAPVVLIGDQQARNLEEFWGVVRAAGVTRLLLVPSALRASLEMPDFSPPPLRVLVLMGEYLQTELAARAISVFASDTSIYSIYGSTEASSTLVCDVRRHFRVGDELPLGEPISDDIEVLIRALDGKPVPPGERGRLFMTGRALFTEYFRDPKLTASVFTSLPDREDKAYDSRDDVRRLPTGDLCFLARADETVKVRGFRVDLPEVERAAKSHDGVRDVAVMMTGDDRGNSRLVGFFSPAAIPVAEIYDSLRARLPEYMVPSALVGVDEFPRAASGKVDKARLLAEQGPDTTGTIRDRPLSDIERRVAATWASILEHEQFGPQTSFFEAGGTSLGTFSLVHRLRVEFGMEQDQLQEQSLYQYPTLEDLSHHIDTILSGQEVEDPIQSPSLVTLRHAGDPRREPLFLIASAGGTLGAYGKLVKALETDREIVGIRDPFLWDARDPTAGFDNWVEVYLDMLRERQPRGPYFITAYSSAGAFAYEMARRLRKSGEDVSLLAIIDPLGIGSGGRSRFGWWVLNAMTANKPTRVATRILGSLRGPLLPLFRRYRGAGSDAEWRITDRQFSEHVRQVHRNKDFARVLSSLFELNTGLTFSLSDDDFANVDPDEYFAVFRDHVAKVIQEFDANQLERIAIQYHLQVRAQRDYQLQRYDGRVLVAEPQSHYAGLLGTQLKPFAKNLRSVVLPLGEPSERVQEIARCFTEWQTHFRSMRDDLFVEELSREMSSMIQ